MSLHPNPESTPPISATCMSTPLSELPQSQVDAIIRTKRKAREPKACYPCHTRKVKCDRSLPCDGCVKRDHPDLCSYGRPSQKRQVVARTSPEQSTAEGGAIKPSLEDAHADERGAATVSMPREEWENTCAKLKEMEHTIYSLRTGMEFAGSSRASPPGIQIDEGRALSDETATEREGIHAPTELGNGTTYLGSRSVLAYIIGKAGTSQETSQALFEGDILPKLGLDNESATYPFVDLWSSDNSARDIGTVCRALPNDQECRTIFGFYRDIAATIYPVVPDTDHFESKLERLLENRAAWGLINADTTEELETPYGMSVAFIGLLFAILAAGCQSSDLPGQNRQLTSQVYVCCSYQCLRSTNFMSRPTIEAIQTLLIIGNVLSYNMNPGVSYILLGMSLRMGLAMGLQVESHRFSPEEQFIRRRVWWSTAWQDSHFSLSYDRPSTMAFSHPDIPYHVTSAPNRRSFFETLCRIIALTLEIVRGRMLSPNSQMGVKAIQTYKEQLRQIFDDAAPHLRDERCCNSQKENLERLGLKLHSSYIESELCRPTLKPDFDPTDSVKMALRRDCIDSLRRTVESYVQLHSVNPHASRSWIGLQRTISCAFLLAVIPESKTDPRVWELLRDLERVIAERAADDAEYERDATPGSKTTSAAMTSPEVAGAQRRPADRGISDVVDGITNVPISSVDPNAATSSPSIPASVPADIESQWSKPLLKSLRALQKLNAAFITHSQQQQGAINSPRNLGFPGPSTPHPGTGTVPVKRESLTPMTPESSGSGEWTFPNLLDRASEYIYPPLWA